MIDRWQRTSLFSLVVAVVLGVGLTGCGSSVPGLGDAENAMEDGRYQEALDHLDRAIEQDTLPVEPLLLRAKVLRKMADTSQAPDAYADLYRRAYDAEERAQDLDSLIRDRVDRRRSRVYKRQFQMGEDIYNLASKNKDPGGFRASAAYFGGAGATRPDSARPFQNMTYAHLKRGERSSALSALQTYAERADSMSKSMYTLLGQLHIEEGQYEAAGKVLDQGTTVYPNDEQLQTLRITAYNRAGNVDELLDVYRKQIEKAPNTATYRYSYGSLLIKAKRYTEAIDHLRKSVEMRPEHVQSQFNLGAAYLNAARARDDSIKALEEGASASPSERDRERVISDLNRRRTTFLERAIPPLERARKMSEPFSSMERNACRALLTAYMQTDRPNRAAQVEECSQLATPGS